MSMKKILMAAAAVTALTAGSASALSITEAKVATVVAYTGTASTPYKVASELKFPSDGTGYAATNATTVNATNLAAGTNAAATDNRIVIKVDQGKLTNGGSSKDYSLVLTYTGSVGFSTGLSGRIGSNANSTSPATCSPTYTIADGGLAKGKTASILVSLGSGCTATDGPDTFYVDAPLTMTGIGDVTVSAKLSTGGTSIDNGDATARTLISNASAIQFSTDTDTTVTNWVLAGTTPYTALSSDTTIGKYTLNMVYAADSQQGPYVDLAKRLSTAETISADVKIDGDVSTTTILVDYVKATKNATKDSSTRSGVTVGNNTAADSSLAAKAIKISADSGITTSQPSRAYSMTVTPVTASTKLTVPAAKTQTLQTVGLEGTNFNVPWVAGSQSPSSTVIRIANNGTTDSGVVTVMIKSPIRNEGTTAGATTCTSSTLSSLGKIAAGGELLLGATELKSCFGDFKRGDLIVTIQGAKTSLTAKARLTTASGQISETSIGGLNEFGAY
jgi:hypothetical protein